MGPNYETAKLLGKQNNALSQSFGRPSVSTNENRDHIEYIKQKQIRRKQRALGLQRSGQQLMNQSSIDVPRDSSLNTIADYKGHSAETRGLQPRRGGKSAHKLSAFTNSDIVLKDGTKPDTHSKFMDHRQRSQNPDHPAQAQSVQHLPGIPRKDQPQNTHYYLHYGSQIPQ